MDTPLHFTFYYKIYSYIKSNSKSNVFIFEQLKKKEKIYSIGPYRKLEVAKMQDDSLSSVTIN